LTHEQSLPRLKGAYVILEAAATDLKTLSYAELERLAELHESADHWQIKDIQVDGKTVRIYISFAKIGRLRKRVSVEMNLSAEDEKGQSHCPFIYFERYKSGRFYPSPQEESRQAALLKSLPYAFLGAVVIGLLALVWHLFVRGG